MRPHRFGWRSYSALHNFANSQESKKLFVSIWMRPVVTCQRARAAMILYSSNIYAIKIPGDSVTLARNWRWWGSNASRVSSSRMTCGTGLARYTKFQLISSLSHPSHISYCSSRMSKRRYRRPGWRLIPCSNPSVS